MLLWVLFSAAEILAQPVTGVWRGKLQKGGGPLQATYKLELKLVKKGDSLLGTSYYYANANNYYRYRVKGYFDARDNAVHWWDDELLAYKSSSSPITLGFLKNQPLQATADFNCPGGGIMRLDGQAEAENGVEFELHLSKTDGSQFTDEWDAVIEDYFFGMADPDIIDSVAAIAASPVQNPRPSVPPPATVKTIPAKVERPMPAPEKPQPKPPVIAAARVAPPVEKPLPAVTLPIQSTADKFRDRKKIVNTTIPFSGDSVVLQFYDNAEVDGDSIALFLNGTMLFEHIKLTANAYSITILASQMTLPENELTMVAENLGSIPPNTSFMLAYADGKRFTARLESTANSSAVIRLVRQTAPDVGQ